MGIKQRWKIYNTKQELIDYALRKLGAPVLEINVDEDQIDDAVDDTIQLLEYTDPCSSLNVSNSSKV